MSDTGAETCSDQGARAAPNVYQLWVHRESARIYAVRLAARREYRSKTARYVVVGVCGPLDPTTAANCRTLADCSYVGGRAAQELVARREEFTVHVAPDRGPAPAPSSTEDRAAVPP